MTDTVQYITKRLVQASGSVTSVARTVHSELWQSLLHQDLCESLVATAGREGGGGKIKP